MEYVESAWEWIQANPLVVGAAVAGVIVLTWLLNRETKMERETREAVERMKGRTKDKYRDLRPLG